MKKRLIISMLAALMTSIVSTPFDYFSRAEIGAELHVSVPQNYPSIGGLVVTRTVTGTNVYLLGR
jgi:hypothetical protein